MFCAVAKGLIDTRGLRLRVQLHDVQALNEHLLDSVYDVSKVSFHAYLRGRESYALLDAGAALGFGCGPIVVARSEDALADAASARVAVPGELTTAHLLLRIWNPEVVDRVFVRYDRVMPMVLSGEVDAGVIIHESRFVYREAGLVALADLGEWWERETGLPIPLGGIVARRSLGEPMLKTLDAVIRDSIDFACRHPDATTDYVSAHARELSKDVLDRHIAMFVNDFSVHLGDQGREAIERLGAMARVVEDKEPA